MNLQQKYCLSEIRLLLFFYFFWLSLPYIVWVTGEVFNVFSALKEILSDFNLIFLKIQTVSNYGLKTILPVSKFHQSSQTE